MRKRNKLRIILLLNITLITINSPIMAQKKQKYKEVKITKTSEVIHVSADSLWNIVKQFDNVGDYFTSIDSSEGRGKPEFEGATCSERTCHVNIRGYSEVHEKLTSFDDKTKQLAYQYTGGGPGFLLFAGNQWKVLSVGQNQSVLKMEATMRLKRFMGFLFGGKLKRIVERELPVSLNELKIYAETGKPSEAKLERIKTLSLK